MIFNHQLKYRKILFIVFVFVLLIGIFFLILKNKKEPVPFADSSEFGNNQIEEAITNYLLTQERFSWKIRDDSFDFCAIENLDPEKELFPLYIWVYCGEYIIQNNKLKTISSFSGPAKIDYPNELSFYDVDRFSYQAPRDGSYYTEDIKDIFPENVQQRIFNFNRDSIIERLKSKAFSNILSWDSIKQSINECEVERAWQTHNKVVTIELKDGGELIAVEPNIDDIFVLIDTVEDKCGKVIMGTE